MNKSLPFFIIILGVALFYWPYFFKHFVPVPLDIVTGMYHPWMDQRYDIFPNGGPVKNPLPSDVVSLTLPLRQEAVSQLKSGQLPLWNQAILSGTPLLGNFQSAVFNPLNALYFIPGVNFLTAWSLQIILQPLIAAICFYLFIQKYTNSIIARLLGSFSWAFCGFFSLWMQYNTVVFAALCLPLILHFIDRINQSRWSGFGISLCLAFSFLAGNPPVSLIVVLTSYLYLVITQNNFSTIIKGSLYFAYSICISLPQIATGYDAISQSIRNSDSVASDLGLKYLTPARLITMIIPDYFGNPSTRNTWPNHSYYDNTTLYFGIIPLIFALSFYHSTSKAISKLKLYSFSLFSICLLMMVDNPISRILGASDFLGLSSMVFTRLSFAASLAISILFSINLETFIQSTKKTNRLVYLIVPAIFILVVSYTVQSYQRLNNPLHLISLRNSILPSAIILTSVIVIFFYHKCKRQFYRNALLLAIATLSIFDLYRFFHKYNTFSNTNDFFPATKLTDELISQHQRFIRQSSAILPSNMWMNYQGVGAVSGYDTTYSQRYARLLSLINRGKSKQSSYSRFPEIDRLDHPLNDILAAPLIITNQHTALSSPKYQLIEDYQYYKLYRNTQSVKLVRSIEEAIYSNNEPDMLMTSINHHKSAVIDEKSLSGHYSSAQISSYSSKPGLISFSTTSSGNSFIVVATNYHSGWNLSINNQSSQKIIPTNISQVGFTLPPGQHEIKLHYYPWYLNHTLAISLLSLVIAPTVILLKSPKHAQS